MGGMLQELGMPRAFTDSAEFGGIAPGEGLMIDAVTGAILFMGRVVNPAG